MTYPPEERDEYTSSIQAAEFIIRDLRNSLISAAENTPEINEVPEAWSDAVQHVDNAARELETAFQALGIPLIEGLDDDAIITRPPM